MIKVLDHGYVKLVESWGKGDANESEAAIIEGARQSTQGTFRGWEKDEKLLKFLYEHKHSTPFEMAGMTIEVQAPIFVFREWHRHRTQSYGEMSARYGPLPNLNYVPAFGRIFYTSTTNKQAQGLKPPLKRNISAWLKSLELFYDVAETLYQDGLEAGVPKEVARIVLPVGRYSCMRASANLRNWLGFLTLRMHPDAQLEIQKYAEAVGEIIEQEFPRTWKLFKENETV